MEATKTCPWCYQLNLAGASTCSRCKRGLPFRDGQESQMDASGLSDAKSITSKSWTCSYCKHVNPSPAPNTPPICWECGNKRLMLEWDQDYRWTCPGCKHKNTPERRSCIRCRYQRQEEPPLRHAKAKGAHRGWQSACPQCNSKSITFLGSKVTHRFNVIVEIRVSGRGNPKKNLTQLIEVCDLSYLCRDCRHEWISIYKTPLKGRLVSAPPEWHNL